MKTCKYCGKEFNPHSARQLFCGQKCRNNFNNSTREPILSVKKCARCGTEFVVKSSKHKYCCDECREQAKEEKRAKETHKDKICVVCGKVYHTRSKNSKVCSNPECKKELKRRNRKNREFFVCSECGKVGTRNTGSDIDVCRACRRANGTDSTNLKGIKKPFSHHLMVGLAADLNMNRGYEITLLGYGYNRKYFMAEMKRNAEEIEHYKNILGLKSKNNQYGDKIRYGVSRLA